MRKTLRSLLSLLLLGAAVALPAQAQNEELPLGSALPLGTRAMLDAASGSQKTLASLKGRAGTVVLFWSNDCPWAEKYADRVAAVARAYATRGFGFALVNANDPVAFPEEGADASRTLAADFGVAYLADQGSALARALGATRTPHAYVFDTDDRLVYVGTVDDSPGDPSNVKATYLAAALDAVSAGEPVDVGRTKAFGCTIKFQDAGK